MMTLREARHDPLALCRYCGAPGLWLDAICDECAETMLLPEEGGEWRDWGRARCLLFGGPLEHRRGWRAAEVLHGLEDEGV